MKKVIVTGASGFIGKELTKKLLDDGISVCAVVRDKKKISDLSGNKNLTIVECDLKEYKNLSDLISKDEYDVFYHLAWDGMAGEKFKDYELQLNNVKYACDSIMSAKEIGCSKFVLVGTMNELEVRAYLGMHECKPRFTCIYGMSKLTSGMLCKTLAFNYGMQFNSIMLAKAYGYGDKSETLPKVTISNLMKNITLKLVEGNYLYDWIYIDDVIDGLMAVGKRGMNFKTYYLGHRNLKTFRRIIEEVRDILNPEMKLIFGEYKDSSMIDYSLIDLDSLYNDTGFECKADFKESILNTAQWVKTLDKE